MKKPKHIGARKGTSEELAELTSKWATDFLDEVVAKRTKRSPAFKLKVAQARLNRAAVAWAIYWSEWPLEDLTPCSAKLVRAVRAFEKASNR